MSRKKYKRKKIFVSAMIQGRMLTRLAMYWIFYHVVLWHAMFVCHYMEYRGELLGGSPAVPFGELYASFVLDHYSLVVCALAVSPIVAWDMLRLTHRVAGPLVRLQRSLSEMAQGKVPEKIRLRKGDLLLGLQNAFNDYLDCLSHRDGATNHVAEAEKSDATRRQPTDQHEKVLQEVQALQSAVGVAVGSAGHGEEPFLESEESDASEK